MTMLLQNLYKKNNCNDIELTREADLIFVHVFGQVSAIIWIFDFE